MRHTLKRWWAPMVLAALCLPPARAQQQTPPPATGSGSASAPTQAAGGQSAGTGKSAQDPATPVLAGSPTVTGSIAPSLGETSDARSQISGGLQFSELFDSNLQDLASVPGWDEVTTIGGHMELHHIRPTSDLMVRYVGGGYIDARASQFDTSYHQLEASQTLQFRRWSLKLDDVFSYLPEAAFGFGGDGLNGNPGIGLTVLNPFALQSQSILTDLGKRVSNTSLAEVQVNATQRSSWTFTGSYGLLHFTDSVDLDSTDASFSAGYNYQLSARDVIGFGYSFSAFRFSPAIQSINDNTVQATYGRHLSNRLKFQAGIGPDMYTESFLFAPSAGVHVTLASNASLIYQVGQTSLNGTFTRGITGGSGIIAGSSSNTATLSLSHKFGQWTTVIASAGFALNSSLPGATPTNTNYDTVNASIGFNRQISRAFSINASYNFVHQNTNALTTCVGAGCAGSFQKHQIWVGFSWDFQPIGLR